jgi:hypothetical protein
MLNRLHNLGMIGNSRDTAEIALLDIPQPGCVPFVVGTIGAAYEAPADVDCFLTRNDERLLKELSSMLDRQLLAALDCRSVSEFAKVRAEVWPKYCRALRALSDTIRNMAHERDIDRVAKMAMESFGADLQKQRGTRFSDQLTDQAVFTLWTLGKIRTLSFSLTEPTAAELRGTDLQLCHEYRLCSLWAQFHMDLVVASINFHKAIPEDIQGAICDGLRAVVNAYAIMKEAYALRNPRAERPAAMGLPWDEEDEQLLAASMRDMNADSSDSGS